MWAVRQLPLKTLLIPLAVLGTAGLATAEVAAHPTLIGNGSTSVSGCSAGAHVTPHVGYSDAASGYQVTSVSIVTISVCAGLTYNVSLLGADGQLLAESTGRLGRDGSAEADFTSRHLPADKLGGVAITVTGAAQTYFR